MKFAIFRDIEIRGSKQRKFLVEWDKDDVIAAFKSKGADIEDVLNEVIEEFKKESIKIP